jgi:Tol biopolymer transport system component
MRCKFFLLALAIFLTAGLIHAEMAVRLEGVRQIKAPDFDILSAVWSPDGSTLALTKAKYRGIYLLDAQTGEITAIAEEAMAGYRLAWSPDGLYIAYKAAVDPSSTQKVIKLADVRTGEIRTLSEQANQVGTPSWFPDGRLGYTLEGNFLIVDQQGEILETIPNIASNVAPVSADGQWILFNDSQDRIWAHHLVDGERFQITPDGRRFFNPVWSPQEPVAIVNELGGGFYLLDLIQGDMLALDDGNHYAWSPDGKRIVYDVTEDDGHYITAADIYVINKDGTGRTALTTTAEGLEMYPTWSRVDKIAYSQPDGQLFVANAVAQAKTDLRRDSKDNLQIRSRR